MSVQLFRNPNSPRLALGPSAALNRNPTLNTSFNDTSQAVSQPNVSQQPIISRPSCLASRSKQLQEQGFSVEVTENCYPSKVIYKDCLQIKVGPI